MVQLLVYINLKTPLVLPVVHRVHNFISTLNWLCKYLLYEVVSPCDEPVMLMNLI